MLRELKEDDWSKIINDPKRSSEAIIQVTEKGRDSNSSERGDVANKLSFSAHFPFFAFSVSERKRYFRRSFILYLPLF
jgi:hypothetical protein